MKPNFGGILQILRLIVSEFLHLFQINPQHNIPAIVDGDLTLNDGHAIVAYLANAYAPNNAIYPSDPRVRAKVDQMMYFDTNLFYKTFGEIVVSFKR